MTSESLREQVEKRIALNRDLMTCTKNDGVIVSCDSVIRELEQVLTLIDEKAKELEANAIWEARLENMDVVMAYTKAIQLIGQPKKRDG